MSAKATLAHQSFSTVQVLVANNTLNPQLLGSNSLPDPQSLKAQASETDKYPTKNTTNNVISSDSPAAETDALPPGTLSQLDSPVRTTKVAAATNSPNQLGSDDQGTTNSTQSLPSSNLSARSTQANPLSSDVANIEPKNFQISGVPTPAARSEASVVILVPPPRTQVIPVQSVTRLPRVIKTNAIPRVTSIPTASAGAKTISPTPHTTAFATNVTNQSSVESIYPLLTPAPITSRFGWRTHPLTGSRRFHSGIDIAAPSGTPVVATASGTVVSAGWNGGYGKAIVIQHSDTQQTLYGHLSEISVQPGQEIDQGMVIGLVGSTGNSTGPHLHFESRVPNAAGWVAVDPAQEIQYAVDNLRRSLPFARKDLPQGL